jgi:hypothetical protein
MSEIFVQRSGTMERNPLLFTITMDFLAIIISQGKEKQ